MDAYAAMLGKVVLYGIVIGVPVYMIYLLQQVVKSMRTHNEVLNAIGVHFIQGLVPTVVSIKDIMMADTHRASRKDPTNVVN